jgi:hypothetical protein
MTRILFIRKQSIEQKAKRKVHSAWRVARRFTKRFCRTGTSNNEAFDRNPSLHKPFAFGLGPLFTFFHAEFIIEYPYKDNIF